MKQLTIALALVVSSAALAQQNDPRYRPNEPGYTAPRSPNSGAARQMESGQSFRGEVQAIDKISGKITLKHDSIGALGVPASTTDYAVKDSSMLEHVKVGDQVRFSAVLQGRSLLVTNIAPAN
jgi:Cu/Ag efflux protein CusF